MAIENPGITHTFRSSTGLKQYQFVDIVKQTGDSQVARLTNPSALGGFVGVLVSSGTTGSTGRAGSTDSGSVQSVQITGIAKVLSGSSSIVTGDYLRADTDGRVIPASTNSTHAICGRALAAGASTSTTAEIISVLIQSAGTPL